MPGVSRKTIWPSGRVRTPIMRVRVVCGLSDTMAIFSPTSLLSSVDLPAFGRPISATVPDLLFWVSIRAIDFGNLSFYWFVFIAAACRVFNLSQPHAIDALAVGFDNFKLQTFEFKFLSDGR